MNDKAIRSAILLCLASGLALSAAGEGSLWGWNVSAGGNIGFGLKTDLRTLSANAMSRMPALHPAVGPTRTEAANAVKNALAAGKRVAFTDDKSAFVDPQTDWVGGDTMTQNWRLPDSAANTTEEAFEFTTDGGYGRQYVREDDGSWGRVGEWSEIVPGSASIVQRDLAERDNDVAWGASVDLSHVLYISEEGNWGVDISFGLAWMISRNCHRGGGTAVRRNASVESGTTDIRIGGADFLGYAAPEDGGWGSGTPDGSSGYTTWALDTTQVAGTPHPNAGGPVPYSDSMYISSHGDYQEWELSALLKPWYDVNDWLCVHGAIGVGVTRSSFDYSMEAICNGSRIYQSSQEFTDWNVYGIAGAGVLLRAWDFDLSCDGLFRWCQEDMDINGRDVKGSISKPWGVLRLGLSYAF